jgi:hypothetical protein
VCPQPVPLTRRTNTASECGPEPARRGGRCSGTAALLSACQTPRERLLMLLLQRVGLRNAALRNLMLQDVTENDPPHPPRSTGPGPPLGGRRGQPARRALEKGGVVRPFVLDHDVQECLRGPGRRSKKKNGGPRTIPVRGGDGAPARPAACGVPVSALPHAAHPALDPQSDSSLVPQRLCAGWGVRTSGRLCTR